MAHHHSDIVNARPIEAQLPRSSALMACGDRNGMPMADVSGMSPPITSPDAEWRSRRQTAALRGEGSALS